MGQVMGTPHLPELAGVIWMPEAPKTNLLIAASLILWFIARLAQRNFRNLPPGPKGLPFVGDVRHITNQGWLVSPKRRDEYGEMMYISALGRKVLIINSQRVAIDLLEKRSNIYSDRPRYISARDYLTKNLVFSLMPYGDVCRRFRRIAVESFSKSTVPRFQPIQGREAITVALALIKNPSNPLQHLQRQASSIMLSINYDLPPIDSEDDPVVMAIMGYVKRMLYELQAGNRLVEYFPWLRYVPRRFAKWKQVTENGFVQSSLLFEGLLGKVENDLANGIDRPSFSASVITNQSKHNFSKHELAWLVGHMFASGGETTSTTLQWWTLAMIAYPEVQKQAHAEIDEVVGSARPPTFADLPALPYIRALVKETLRWSLTIPLGLPHVSNADDWYEGMFIPKGTICYQNMRVINSDPEVFGSDGARFDPTRYLAESCRIKVPDGREEGHVTFGFGRRLCPGRHFAEATLSITIATLLWAMRFERPEGVQAELDLRTFIRGGLTAHPVPYEYKAVPRFAEAEALLKEAQSLYE
ncbi:cytochrome P450 [Lactarius psammicola]|nr:cytochrome P450 [Lactarius psammicola]